MDANLPRGIISDELFDLIRNEFALDLHGIHGLSHWLRVRENGLRVAQASGADMLLVELFALLHDVKREDEGVDRYHGQRAASYVKRLPHMLLNLSQPDMELLTEAIAYHSEGLTVAHVTVQTCWDADRLDLGRVGIVPKPRYLCTTIAKEPDVITWAHRRSLEQRRSWWAWYGEPPEGDQT